MGQRHVPPCLAPVLTEVTCLTTAVLSLSVVSLEPQLWGGALGVPRPRNPPLYIGVQPPQVWSLGLLHSPKCPQDVLHVAKVRATPLNMGLCQYLPVSSFVFERYFQWGMKRGRGRETF